jgi:hypothetical protein
MSLETVHIPAATAASEAAVIRKDPETMSSFWFERRNGVISRRNARKRKEQDTRKKGDRLMLSPSLP